MKHTKFFIFALVAAMTFSACGTDDTLQFYYPENGGTTGGGNTGGGSTGGNTGGESTDKNNTNKNVATANMPQVVRNAIGGLEFPKLKNNGSSYAIVQFQFQQLLRLFLRQGFCAAQGALHGAGAGVGVFEIVPVGHVGRLARVASIVRALNICGEECPIGRALDNPGHVVTQRAQGHFGDAVNRDQFFLATIDTHLGKRRG